MLRWGWGGGGVGSYPGIWGSTGLLGCDSDEQGRRERGRSLDGTLYDLPEVTNTDTHTHTLTLQHPNT